MRGMRFISKAIAMVAVALAIGSCADAGRTPLEPSPQHDSLIGDVLGLLTQPATSDVVSEAVIGPEGGRLEIAGGHSLTFPPGALAQPTTIRATRDPARIEVEFEPHGLTFPANARPTLSYSFAGTLGLLGLPFNLLIVYLGDGGAVQEVLLTDIDLFHQVARARISHFSTYALATDRDGR